MEFRNSSRCRWYYLQYRGPSDMRGHLLLLVSFRPLLLGLDKVGSNNWWCSYRGVPGANYHNNCILWLDLGFGSLARLRDKISTCRAGVWRSSVYHGYYSSVYCHLVTWP